jgi:hypothetical protein
MPACLICSEEVSDYIPVHAGCLNPYDDEPEGEEDDSDA